MPAMADGHGDHRKGGERMKNALKQMDADNDGAISFDEFRMPEGRMRLKCEWMRMGMAR